MEGIADYLGRLGVSHAYLSPILEARPGSTHGYDTVDHRSINPELGTLDEFRQMARTLRAVGVSIILDIVPNHMGIGGDRNDLWLDVLEWGRESPYAAWFDIDWEPLEPTLTNKVLVPFLGSAYGEALRDGALVLGFDENAGEFAVWAENAHKLPICPTDYGRILALGCGALEPLAAGFSATARRAESSALKDGLAKTCAERPEVGRAIRALLEGLNTEPGRANLASLIDRQHWRPARASVAADDINYRRFFTVSDLAAIRIERDDVFDHVHALTFRLVEEGLVDGLRIDHIDGLYDPEAYCLTLRRKCPRPIYLLVEKILAPHELLRSSWNVDGTTGYEFSATVTQLLMDPASETILTRTYKGFTSRTEELAEVERDAKLSIIDLEMAAELDALSARLRSIASANPSTVDFTRNALRTALRATVAELNVYRTYVAKGDVRDSDQATIVSAIARARAALPSLDQTLFAFIERVMTASAGPSLDAAMRIQQYTGPVMAKGLEDTALYRYNRLIALSDVGAKPDRFTRDVASFHGFMTRRISEQKNGLLGTSSHDTKRGEDARARIAALSGHAEDWATSVHDWAALLRRQGAPKIDPNDSYYFFQLLVGAWPTEFVESAPLPVVRFEAFRDRVQRAMLKSVREARTRTNWHVPNTEYEERVLAYVKTALTLDTGNAFLPAFRRFEGTIAWDGAQNGLIQTVLKLTVPGVPDIYQGAELWEQSMVDPDNRRPVDFAKRQSMLEEFSETDLSLLADDFRSGAIKLAAMSRLLAFRARHPALFAQGTYEPVPVAGPDADRIVAFQRQWEGVTILVAIVLFPWRGPALARLQALPPTGAWHDLLKDRDVEYVDLISDAQANGLPCSVWTCGV